MANADKPSTGRQQQDSGRQRQQPAQQNQGKIVGSHAGGRSGQQVSRKDASANTGKGAGQPGAKA
ncbi:MAG TPA: hypothetical protein VFN88_06145 [Caulobacteraceae bacterium]|nr:hypothetical protein [Caulobacteraceae bacterium]